MEKYAFTVVVPAHNEEKYVVRCINSIKKAADHFAKPVEIIVVCNRCTDKTQQLAEANGARTLLNEHRICQKRRHKSCPWKIHNDYRLR